MNFDLFKGQKSNQKRDHWIPDSVVSKCPICETNFSVFIRKHHCRACGKIFCNNCTSSRRPLIQFGFKNPVRLCDICAKDVAISTDENVSQTEITHTEIIKEWVFLINTVETHYTKELERKILRGIPNTLRSLVWTALSDATSIIDKNNNIYEIYKSKPNPNAEQPILLDIPRTFPEHPRFGDKGSDTQSLFNVLKAFANFDPSIGYCQGMSFIVATLLMHMNEENAFWVFIQMMKKYELAPFYSKALAEEDQQNTECHPALVKFTKIFQSCLPNLDAHLRRQGCVASVFALKWIKTLFSDKMDTAIVFRLWDIFFVQQMDFIINFIIAMFILEEDTILGLAASDVLMFLTHLPPYIEPKFDEILKMSVKSTESFVNILALTKRK